MIVVIFTLLMLVWILGVGFLYYQKYTVRIVTNDVAKKIAATYEFPTTDIIMGYVSRNDVIKKSVYDYASLDDNQERCQSYVNYMMDRTNLYGTVENIEVTIDHQTDGLGRSHVSVTTVCIFDTPFGEVLEYFGMSGLNTYKVTSYADSTDLSQYISAVTTADMLTGGSIIKMPKIVTSTVSMIKEFTKAFNRDK